MKKIVKLMDLLLGVALIIYIVIINLISSNRIAFSTPILLVGLALIIYNLIKDKFKDKKLFIKLRKIAMILICIGLGCFFVIETLIIAYPKNNKENSDYIIVLGAGLKNKTEVSLTLEDRLKATLECVNKYRNNGMIIVSGGKGKDENISEAQAMKKYLVEHGIDEDRILMEDKSTNTSENLKFSKKIIEKNSGKSVADNKIKVITTDFHAFRSSIIAKKNDYENIDIYSSDTIGYLIPIYYAREGVAVVKTAILD